jgi:phospholipase C
MNRLRLAIGIVVATAVGLSMAPAKAGLFTAVQPPAAPMQASPQTSGLSKIQHLIFIVQENRSFDEFFGTFPGADGIPTSPPCQIDPWYPSNCDKPYLNHDASNLGGPYMNPYQVQDIDGGKMDGFVESREQQLGPSCAPQNGKPPDPNKIVGYHIDEEGIGMSSKCRIDVMGYHDGKDLPNYWAYAQNYVLYDHFYESAESWSLPAHLALFSGWSAKCTTINPPDINSCTSDLGGTIWNPDNEDAIPYLWTDITYLLYKHNISWISYLDGGLGMPIGGNGPGVQGIWIPLGGFETVNDDGQINNAIGVQTTQFYTDAANGTLPQVSWLLPTYLDSDHPQASIKNGQSYVTGLVNAVMNGPDWNSSAIFIVWDDMGGFYDHEPPPFSLDFDGPGLRTGAILISPYAKTSFIDHQTLTTDSFLKLIEDVFLRGKRLSQSGRPDPRPDYRDQSKMLGDLKADFDFKQNPRPPMLLSTHPMTTLIDNNPDVMPPSTTVRGVRRGIR